MEYKTKSNKRAFTLLEIVLAVIILSIVCVGLISIFGTGKRYILHARMRMAGGELGELFLNPLQSYVSQGERSVGASDDGWDDNNNALRETPGASKRHCGSAGLQQPFCPAPIDLAARTLAGIEYSAEYVIKAIKADASATEDNLRKVVTTINWTEP